MKEEEYEKVRFKDLSWPLRTLVVFGWFTMAINILYFIAGFLLEMMGVA